MKIIYPCHLNLVIFYTDLIQNQKKVINLFMLVIIDINSYSFYNIVNSVMVVVLLCVISM